MVSAWADKSGNATNAIPKTGTVTHPAGNTFASGRVGLDFGDTLRLSWTTIPGSILESSSTLQAPDWTHVTGLTILEQNGTSYVDISVSSPGKRFFRLRW